MHGRGAGNAGVPGDSGEGEEDGRGRLGRGRGGGRRRVGLLVRFGGRLSRDVLESRGAAGVQPQGHTPVLRGDLQGTGVIVKINFI